MIGCGQRGKLNRHSVGGNGFPAARPRKWGGPTAAAAEARLGLVPRRVACSNFMKALITG